MALPNSEAANKIYIIFQICHLGREGLNVKIFVGPDAHKREGSLVFDNHTWTVIPRNLL